MGGRSDDLVYGLLGLLQWGEVPIVGGAIAGCICTTVVSMPLNSMAQVTGMTIISGMLCHYKSSCKQHKMQLHMGKAHCKDIAAQKQRD